ncbi:hemerythrin domain-containing protein [Streptomyces sp. NBC_01217]|uniref:hemerythrin domain-containing protein n=1 Tax=Streptomyces sp. NBC_01217 TaxID=2903779 RepID=UPI002E0EF5CF|nr:hemerythrin domain-containing protein [Streptomyces sp. NBC_01217]WSQ62550.1 hemerythrin domain-containing protein [Streptomyces sp. NBC_01217]
MADVRDMYMAHAMLRREFRLLPQLVRDVKPSDVERAKAVGAHADHICFLLHLHHEGEDLLLWPLLLERAGDKAAAIVPTMEEQHGAIERHYTEVTELLPQWRATAQQGERLAGAIERLLSALVEHLMLEEKEILPLAGQYVTAAEWKQLGAHGMAKTPPETMPLALGMAMYEADPEVFEDLLADVPEPARLVLTDSAQRAYADHAQRLYGTSTPPRVGN